MNRNEPIKYRVMSAIKESGGNIPFDTLMDACELNFVELSAIIGSLLKERQIGLYISNNTADSNNYRPRVEVLFKRFQDLLSVYFTQERSVEFYASKLCITSKYLAAVVKQASGKTPTAWITEKVISEIKHRLRYSQATIKEIAYELNFCNVSFLGKYFKSQIGMSPSRYRVTCDQYGQTR